MTQRIGGGDLEEILISFSFKENALRKAFSLKEMAIFFKIAPTYSLCHGRQFLSVSIRPCRLPPPDKIIVPAHA